MINMIKRIRPWLLILLGATILSFGLYNIHAQSGLTEGGELGMELLLLHWFSLSPAFSSIVLDATFYLLGLKVLGRKFIKIAVVATLCYSLTYMLWEHFPPLLPDLSAHLLSAAILGGCFVGAGCGLVVAIGGACSGDDALAMSLSSITGFSLSRCYFLTDTIVLFLSLSYLPVQRVLWSLLSASVSSWIIGRMQKVVRSLKLNLL